ncbi:MAG: M3 family metallopeptidase [Candidatus Marinimicrobia bacterium]|nr:M3 family metallopeptidase [Candidatus Neomarinimicrobiota bacterium]
MKHLPIILMLGLFLVTCGKNSNPFLTKWDNPFQIPPFDKIEMDHYMPAFEKGIEQEKEEIETIINNTEAPDFENTIVALEKSGELLRKVSGVFYNLKAANTNEKMNEMAKILAPMLSKHNDEIALNEKLFQRIKTVYENNKKEDLNTEEMTVLEKYYKDFVRSGALLSNIDKERIKEINSELSTLTLQFGDNVLEETNRFELKLTDEADLAGLPENVITMGKEAAQEKGYENAWVYTIQRTSLYPFLTYSERRDLREKLFKGYTLKGDNNDELDNKELIKKILKLRQEKAKMLGYESHAHYALENTMAKSPERVNELLMKIWEPSLKKAKAEAYDMQKMIYNEGQNFKLMPWDWWYYAEKIKKEKYGLDEALLSEYFQMENVRQGAFDLATKLWGITFKPIENVNLYHKDVEAFEVIDADGKHLAVFMTDYYPRSSKEGGAWMDAWIKQSNIRNHEVRPIVYNVGNFAKPSGGKPSLLTFDQVTTLFHEFGHGLHGMLSQCEFPRVSGTSVPRDFVEFPSQIMENWAGDPEYIKVYAKHYQTGEPVPDELLEKLEKAGTFNQGFITVEYMAAALLDMAYHTQTNFDDLDVNKFEKNVLNELGLIDEIVVRYRSTYFNHIFSGGYSAGYYSYIWSGVLDTDGYEAFKETGDIYNQKVAKLYRENVLEKGGSEDAMDLFVKFRGREPEPTALLKKRGLN